MNVTIIGAGNMGRGIGTVAVRGGNHVTLIDEDPEAARRLADELQAAGSGTATPGRIEDIQGDVVVLAIYYPANKELAQQLGARLAGKVVVDIANPVDSQTFEPATRPGSSSAEELAAVVPQSAKVVKAFNTTFAGTLVTGEVAGQPLDVYVAGDDAEAKKVVAQLARDGGLNPIDVGSLKRAQQLEALGYLHISLQQPLGTGFGSAVKLISP